MREPAFAGYFYPGSESELRKQLEACFTDERGPGSLPQTKRKDRNVVAAIVPHAGYQYSGACAAWAYHALAASPRPSLYLLLGPNHNSLASGTSMETWKTPLGMVRADQEFVRALVKKGHIGLDDGIMAREHSLEVQLPFLQYVVGETLKVCPILLSDDVDLAQLALDIKETLVEQGKTAVIVASSDFTHHGPDYRYVRFTEEPAKQIAAFDGEMLDLITAQDADGFRAFVDKEMATVCGARAIELLLRVLKKAEVKIEQYYTSGDLAGSYRNSVSYAAVVFER